MNIFFIFPELGYLQSSVHILARPSSHKYASMGSNPFISTYSRRSNFFFSRRSGVLMYRCTRRSECQFEYRFLGMHLKLSIKNIPSPPLPEFGLAMNVNLGCCSIYASRAPASSGSKKLIGENPNCLSKVFRILLVIEQKTFFLHKYSTKGYLFQQNLFLATLLKSL